jgi:hypothetical protein
MMVVVFSSNANGSKNVRKEIERAVNKGVTIIPLRVQDVIPSRSLEFFLGNIHWLDAITPPLEKHLEALAIRLTALMGSMPVTMESAEIRTESDGRDAPENESAPVTPFSEGRIPAQAATSAGPAESGFHIPTLRSWPGAAQKGLNWRHYASLAALATVIVALSVVYVMRTPNPKSETRVEPAPVQRSSDDAGPVTPPVGLAIPPQSPKAPAPPPRIEAATTIVPKRAPQSPKAPAPPPRERSADLPTEPNEVPTRPNAVTPKASAPSAPREAATPAPPVTFNKVKFLVPDGDKTRERDVVLRLQGDRLAIEDEDLGSTLRVLPYASIDGGVYSLSKHPRWKSGLVAVAAVGVFAAPIFFMKGTKHWFTLHSGDDFVVLQLDKNNYRAILPAFEKRSGISVDRKTDEK